jgi:hypothetical protein
MSMSNTACIHTHTVAVQCFPHNQVFNYRYFMYPKHSFLHDQCPKYKLMLSDIKHPVLHDQCPKYKLMLSDIKHPVLHDQCPKYKLMLSDIRHPVPHNQCNNYKHIYPKYRIAQNQRFIFFLLLVSLPLCKGRGKSAATDYSLKTWISLTQSNVHKPSFIQLTNLSYWQLSLIVTRLD